MKIFTIVLPRRLFSKLIKSKWATQKYTFYLAPQDFEYYPRQITLPSGRRITTAGPTYFSYFDVTILGLPIRFRESKFLFYGKVENVN